MAGASPVSGSYTFRGVECMVTMITSDDNQLTLQVEDQVTTDQWRACFDAPFIEDLTRKTGNYKQFPIFVNMMESAILKSSESVSLDLLTYSDLEKLRSRKTNALSSKHIPSAARNPTLNSKRYLILTYTVEFDRIHYPLPLPYVGKPDPKLLQETIKQLKAEIKSLKKHGMKDYRAKELEKLQIEYDRLAQEKEELEAEYISFRREVTHTKVGSAAKEIRILKEIIKNLEEDLLKERTKYTRASTRRSQEHRRLIKELEEVKASERNLRARVKSLTNELNTYKRGRSVTSGMSSRENSYSRDVSRNSRLSTNNSNNSRNSSRERSRERSRLREKPLLRREYSSSRERSLSRDRSSSFERTKRNTSAGSRNSFKNREPSPLSSAGARLPRFDPSAYIKEKQKKLSDTKRKKRPHSASLERIHRNSSNLSDHSVGRISRTSRTSSAGSLRSRTSSIESLSDVGIASDTSDGRHRRTKKVLQSVKTLNNAWSGSDVSYTSKSSRGKSSKTKKILSSTPESIRTRSKTVRDKENIINTDDGDSDYFDRSAEIGEIDARLNRLQQFMKNNL